MSGKSDESPKSESSRRRSVGYSDEGSALFPKKVEFPAAALAVPTTALENLVSLVLSRWEKHLAESMVTSWADIMRE